MTITDWGREANRLEKLSRRELIEIIHELGGESDFLRHQTKERLIKAISRMTMDKYDTDGNLIVQKTWKDKARRVIADLCATVYRQANPKPGKKHVPYRVPAIAQKLVDCLNRNDEVAAKDIFVRMATGNICGLSV